MSFDPTNAPTGSPEEVLGDDDGGAQPADFDEGDTQVAEGGDIDTSDGDSGGGGDTDTSGTRTTAPDPSDPPDPDPSDVTRDPDPTQPEPAPAPDQQQAEGADDPDAGTGGGGGDTLEPIERSEGRDTDTSPDEPAEPTPSTPSGTGSEFGPTPDDPLSPEEADTTGDGGAQPGGMVPGETTGEGQDIGDDVDRTPPPDPTLPEGPDLEPEFPEGAEPVPDFASDAAGDVRQDVADQFQGVDPGEVQVRYLPGENQVVGAPGAAGFEDYLETVEADRQRELAAQFSGGPGPDVAPWQISTDITGERGEDLQIETDIRDSAIEDLFAESPGAASVTLPEEQETFSGSPGAAGSAEATRQQLFQQAAVESGAAEGAELDILPDQFTVEQPDGQTLGEIASGVAGGRRAFEANEAAERGVGIFGAPGTVESALGDVAFGVRDVSRDVADVATEEVVEPGAALFGELAANRPAAVAAGIEDDAAAERLARGFGVGVTESTLGLPAGAVETGAIAAEAGEFTARQVEQQGLIEGGETAAVAGATFGAAAAVDIATAAGDNPLLFGGALAGGVATGVGAGRVIQRAPDVARAAATRARRDPVIDVADEPEPPATTLDDLPAFSEGAMARGPRGARAEFGERMETGSLAEELDEPVAFSVRSPEATREFGGFGREFEAPAQDIEMTLARSDPQGLFLAADPSPLRLPGGPERASPSIGLPRPRIRTGRVAAEADPELSIIPQRRATSIDLPEQDLEGVTGAPPEVLGTIEFMAREADPSQRFIRGETLTPEQEAVAPPGARFEATGQRFALRTEEGAVVPGRVFRGSEGEAGDVDDVAETATQEEIARATLEAERRARARQPATPIAPTVPIGAPAGSAPSTTGFGFGDDSTGITVGNQTGTTPTGDLSESTPFDAPVGGSRTGVGGRDTMATEPTESPTGTTPTGGTTPSQPTGVSEPTSPFGSEPTGFSSPFDSTPTGGTPTPTEPTPTTPSEPTTPSVPTTPTTPSVPSTPRTPRTPGTPTVPGIPTTPTTPGVPGIPGTPTTPQTPRVPGGDDARGRDDEEEFVAPEGTEFFNPIATGQQLLFGDFGGGGESGSENPDPTGLFLG